MSHNSPTFVKVRAGTKKLWPNICKIADHNFLEHQFCSFSQNGKNVTEYINIFGSWCSSRRLLDATNETCLISGCILCPLERNTRVHLSGVYWTWRVRAGRWLWGVPNERWVQAGYKASGYMGKQKVSSVNSMRPLYPDFHHPTLYILPQLAPHDPSAPPDRKRCLRICPGASNFNLLLFTGEYHRSFPGVVETVSGRERGRVLLKVYYWKCFYFGLSWGEARDSLVSSRWGYWGSGFLSHSASRKTVFLPTMEASYESRWRSKKNYSWEERDDMRCICRTTTPFAFPTFWNVLPLIHLNSSEQKKNK